LPKWDITQDQLVNKVEVKGAPQLVETDEGPHKLDGSEDNWDTTAVFLDRRPVSIRVFADTNSTPTTERKAGVEGASTDYEYTVDFDKGIIRWNTSVYAPTASHYVFVEYAYNVPVQVTRRRESSIAKFTGGESRDESFFREDIKTVADAERFAEKYLDAYSEPFFKTDLRVRTTELLQPGVLHRVVDRLNVVDRELLIKSLKTTYPYRYDEIVVSDREYRTADWTVDARQRIKRLEEKQSDNEEILTSIIDMVREFSVQRRSVEVFGLDRSGDGVDTFIIGHHTFGVLGTQKLGDGTSESLERRYLIPGRNTFEEYVLDDEYYDSGSSSGVSWNTSTGEVTFSAGGIRTLTTNTIALGVGWARYKVSLGAYTGVLSVEISPDGGSSWESVVLDTTKSFLNSGTDVRVRIKSDSSGSVLSAVTDSFGRFKKPALRVLLEE